MVFQDHASQDQKILQDHRKVIAQGFVQGQHQRGIAHAEVLPRIVYGGIQQQKWESNNKNGDPTTKMGIQQQKWGFNNKNGDSTTKMGIQQQKWGFNKKNGDLTIKNVDFTIKRLGFHQPWWI